ncbi:MAG: glycogen synthase GlgA [Myxococcales bacterium]|nr:glycogen synthase GlgA [Myxococcales bacterium]
MRVLHVLSELYPLIKTGGLADVGGALTLALQERGVDVHVLLPGYPAVMRALGASRVLFEDSNFFGGGPARILCGELVPPHLPACVLDCPGLFTRGGGPYADENGHDWPDNHRRFAALAWAGSLLAHGLDRGARPDVVHTHDWQAGLLPAYERLRQPEPRPALVHTIHNLAYTGSFDPSVLTEVALPGEAYALEGVEFYGRLSFMKAGLQYADRITTVSRTYAREIQTATHGCGFEGLLRARGADLRGIVNGIDEREWDPRRDPHLPATYDAEDLSGKAACKAALQARMRLKVQPDAPLLGVVSRLAWLKGLDLLPEAVRPALASGAQLLVLGTGEPALEGALRELAAAHPGQVAVRIGFDEALAHLIQAGSDALLVPSRVEPCGLTQLYALRYGTLPVVRRTGGLADTVVDATPAAIANGSATGVVFDEPSVAGLSDALTRTLALYAQPTVFRALLTNGMRQPVGWDAAAAEYEALYGELLATHAR